LVPVELADKTSADPKSIAFSDLSCPLFAAKTLVKRRVLDFFEAIAPHSPIFYENSTNIRGLAHDTLAGRLARIFRL